MAISLKDVEHIASLAMLDLSGEEKENLRYQLSSILDWIKQLDEIDTSNIEPTFAIARKKAQLRKDIPFKFQESSQILSNAPMREFDFIKVKKVIKDE